MFCFKETFACMDEAYKPYGIRIESSSALWHKHARASEGSYTVYCTGNKYLAKNMVQFKHPKKQHLLRLHA